MTTRSLFASSLLAGLVGLPAIAGAVRLANRSGSLTEAPVAARPTASGAHETAVLAGGCFWGIEAVYEHLHGVVDVVSGYAGGTAEDADYGRVSMGRTGHAESVRITFDPSVVSYSELLEVFFTVAHDPTQRNRQGPDVGPQYRSAIFVDGDEQATIGRAYIDKLTRAGTFSRPIVTEVTPLEVFYPAEAYHQDYAERNPNALYILIHDRPKVENLRRRFPAMYRDRRQSLQSSS